MIGYKASSNALVAQLDRATDYESVGRAFESLQAHQTIIGTYVNSWVPFLLFVFYIHTFIHTL